MRKSTGNFIQTWQGKRFYPLDPRAEDLSWMDISHALARICRFTGHCNELYSVAEHSVLVSRRAEELGIPVDTKAKKLGCDRVKITDNLRVESNALYCARWGLLHDASEAYLTDIAKPLKQQDTFAGYREAEGVLQDMIMLWAELDVVEPYEVTRADAELLATEASQIMNPELEKDTWYFKYPPIKGLKIQCWEPKVAEQQFLRRAKELDML